MKIFLRLLAGLALVMLLVLCPLAVAFLLLWPWYGDYAPGPKAQPRPIAARADLSQEEKTNIAIYDQGSRSLVQITNLTEIKTAFDLDVQQVPKGVGSGFVWDQAGHIVTNYHVVDGADAVRVTLSGRGTYEARQIAAYPDQDIAVIRIDAPKAKLHPVLIGTSHDLKVGQVVYALGDPFGLDQTMTTGIISALSRQMESRNGRVIHGVIQISAPINPGNSGGPLLDSSGRLIGMTTAIISPSGAFAGIGFAIPIDEINQVVPQLINHGKVIHPQLGVQIAGDQLAEQLGLKEGALILKVLPNGPAAKAGLHGTRRDDSGQIHLGDIIVAIDDIKITRGKDLFAAMERFHVGDKVKVAILREGARQEIELTLQAAPD